MGISLLKEEKKRKRLTLLAMIDRLIEKCDCEVLEQKNDCDNCKQIASLGSELDNLLNDRFIVACDYNFTDPKERKDMSKEYAEELLDIDTYMKIKIKCKNDKEAAEKCGISYAQLRKWKTVMGLTKEKRK